MLTKSKRDGYQLSVRLFIGSSCPESQKEEVYQLCKKIEVNIYIKT